MCVYEMGKLRLIDLSKIIDPATESRRCHLFRFNTGGAIPDFHTNMDLMSHLGTHCECPYHHDDNWPSVADLPLTTFLGRAVYVDFKETVAKRGHITAADLDREAKKVKEGDIVIIDSSYKLYPLKNMLGKEFSNTIIGGNFRYGTTENPSILNHTFANKSDRSSGDGWISVEETVKVPENYTANADDCFEIWGKFSEGAGVEYLVKDISITPIQ